MKPARARPRDTAVGLSVFPAGGRRVLHHLGLGLQLAALVFLPLLVLWQLNFGFPLLYMPIGLLAGMGLFALGTKLRESGS